jgi:hypothetical protein
MDKRIASASRCQVDVARAHRLRSPAATGKTVVTSANHVRENAMERSVSRLRRRLAALGFAIAAVMGIAPTQAQELCGGVDYPFPYTDVASVGAAFCPGIMEAYVTGVSKGTTPTTFSPDETVTRVQMTTFLQRSLDQGLTRTNRRAALRQWWTTQSPESMQAILVGVNPAFCAADGEYIWTSNQEQVVQVQASTGNIMGTWDAAGNGSNVLVAVGKVFVTGDFLPGILFVLDPTKAPGDVTVAANTLGGEPFGIAFDGTNIWTANLTGSVSIISPATYAVTTVTTGFKSVIGAVYDGAHMWVTDYGAGTLLKLDSSGTILQTVAVGNQPEWPVFDGANIWVPNNADNSITVVQASSGTVVATILQNGTNLLNAPQEISFDGERILVTNDGNNSVTLFKAADLSLIGNISTGGASFPAGTCSDGIDFWVALHGNGNLVRF